MVTVSEAKNEVRRHSQPMEPRRLPLQQSAGLTLAEDIFAGLDIPAFPQSSMDGYAIRFGDADVKSSLQIIGESAAGKPFNGNLEKGTAVRIFTGAAIPGGADTVVMQEKAERTQHLLLIKDDGLQQGQHVRAAGSEIRAGELALTKGTILSAPAVGYLAAIGVSEVMVFARPSVSIIITGNELQQPGNALQPGQVYEANSFALTAALRKAGIEQINVLTAGDDLHELTQVLQQALFASDMVLLTGGVSVGDYDFVVQAAADCGVQPIFHKVKQRPGKPLFFGKKNNRLVFGLPGNPSSVLTCFYQYVLLALSHLLAQDSELKKGRYPLTNSYKKPLSLTCFLKGFFDGHYVQPLGGQESYRLQSFARANCLIQLDEGTEEYKEGTEVEIHWLP